MKMEHIKLSEEVSMYKKCLEDVNEINSKIVSRSKLAFREWQNAHSNTLWSLSLVSFLILLSFSHKVNQQADLHEDLKIKFIKGAKERKELYNKVLELKG